LRCTTAALGVAAYGLRAAEWARRFPLGPWRSSTDRDDPGAFNLEGLSFDRDGTSPARSPCSDRHRRVQVWKTLPAGGVGMGPRL